MGSFSILGTDVPMRRTMIAMRDTCRQSRRRSGKKRVLLSCSTLNGATEYLHTVETDLLLVTVEGPFVQDGALRPKSGHRLMCRGGEGGASAPTPTSASSCLACFPFFNRCMRDMPIFSADQERLPVRTRFAFGSYCPLQPLPLAGGTRRRVGVVAHAQKTRISMVRVNIAVTVRPATAAWLLRLLLSLSPVTLIGLLLRNVVGSPYWRTCVVYSRPGSYCFVCDYTARYEIAFSALCRLRPEKASKGWLNSAKKNKSRLI